MSYTHTYTPTRRVAPAEWAAICDDLDTLLLLMPNTASRQAGGYYMGVPLRLRRGLDDGRGWTINADYIAFNGSNFPGDYPTPWLAAELRADHGLDLHTSDTDVIPAPGSASDQTPRIPVPLLRPNGMSVRADQVIWRRITPVWYAEGKVPTEAFVLSDLQLATLLGDPTIDKRTDRYLVPLYIPGTNDFYPWRLDLAGGDFVLHRDLTERDFIPTGRRPYDLVVCATLIIANRRAPGWLKVTSDGAPKDWLVALNWVNGCLSNDHGYPLPDGVRHGHIGGGGAVGVAV